jgi:hypothetical protein
MDADGTNLLIGIYAGESARVAGVAALTCNLLDLPHRVNKVN